MESIIKNLFEIISEIPKEILRESKEHKCPEQTKNEIVFDENGINLDAVIEKVSTEFTKIN